MSGQRPLNVGRWLIFIYLVGCCGATLLHYKPGFEYIYSLKGNSHSERAGQIGITARIGYVVVNRTDNVHEILLRVHQLHLVPKDHETVFQAHAEYDFSPWFSFEMDSNGHLRDVYEDPRHNLEALSYKKAFAGLLLGKFHHKNEHVQHHSPTRWAYHAQEKDASGEHSSHYTADELPDGIHFHKKVTSAHRVPSSKSDSEKSVHIHHGMRIVNRVKTREHFVAAAEKKERQRDALSKSRAIEMRRFQHASWPDMQTKVGGTLHFVSRQPSSKSLRRPSTIPKGDIELQLSLNRYCQKTSLTYNWAERKETIRQFLRLLRAVPENTAHPEANDWLKEAFKLVRCSQLHHMEELAHEYFGDLTYEKNRIFLPLVKKEAEHLLDVMLSTRHGALQRLLTRLVITEAKPRPRRSMVLRALFLLTHFQEDSLPDSEIEKVFRKLALHQTNVPRALRDPKVVQAALLGLGSIANQYRARGEHDRADAIVNILERQSGRHDPVLFRKKRSTMSDEDFEHFHWMQIHLVEAIGNAGHPRSLGTLLTFVNSTESRGLRRAGIHALRNYHTDQAADVLLEHAIMNDDNEIRHEARLTYLRHPKAKLSKVQGPIDPKMVEKKRKRFEAEKLKRSSPVQVGEAKKNVKIGSFWEGIAIQLEAPGIMWRMIIGNNQAGAEFGVTAMNKLDIAIAPLQGHLQIDVHDEAYARVLIGAIGLIFEIFVARVCFRGKIGYNLNLLQEFSPERIKRRFEQLKQFFKDIMDAIADAIDSIKTIFTTDASQTVSDFVDALEDIPTVILDAFMNVTNTVEKISMLDIDQFPPFVKPSIKFMGKVWGIMKAAKKDMTTFYNAVDSAINVGLPNAWKRMIKGGKMIVDGADEFGEMNIKDGIGQMAKGLIFVGFSMLDFLWIKNTTMSAAFFLREKKPDWMDFRKLHSELSEERTKVADVLNKGSVGYLAQLTINLIADPVKVMSNGTVTTKQLKEWSIGEIRTAIGIILNPMGFAKFVAKRFLMKYSTVFANYMKLKKAYLKMKRNYDVSMYFIQKTFGPKANKNFTRTYRQEGGGCTGTGFWPSRKWKGDEAEYAIDGVDLWVEQGKKVVAPFSGEYIRTGKEELALRITSGSLKNHVVIIHNVLPIQTTNGHRTGGGITMSNVATRLATRKFTAARQVSAGADIGIATTSSCRDNDAIGDHNHIHFAVLKWSKTGTIAPTYSWKAIEPTRFLESRIPGLPVWKSKCDDYKLVWMNQVKAAGSIIGLAGQAKDAVSRRISQKGRKTDMSGAQPASAGKGVQPMDPAAEDKLKRASEDAAKKKAAKNEQMAKEMKDIEDAADNPAPANDTQESIFDKFKLPSWSDIKTKGMSLIMDFIDIRKKTIGNVINFLKLLDMTNTIQQLGVLIKEVKTVIDMKECKNPAKMDEDGLKKELLRKKLDTNGTKDELIKRLTDADPKCLMIGWMLPTSPDRYCWYDGECLAIQCCLTVRAMLMMKTIRTWVSLDPCTGKLGIGWANTLTRVTVPAIPVWDVYVGIQGRVKLNVTLSFLVPAMLYVDYTVVKTENQITMTVYFIFCSPQDKTLCDFVNRIIMMQKSIFAVPKCRQDGSLIWPKGMWTNFLMNPSVKKVDGETTGSARAAEQAAIQLASLQEILGFSPSILSASTPCFKTGRSSNYEMTNYFNALGRGGSISGDVYTALKAEMLKCTKFDSTPYSVTAPPDSAGHFTVEVDANCNRFDACVDLDDSRINGTKSFRVYFDLNPCEHEFHIGFENLQYTEHISYTFPFGKLHWMDVGSYIRLWYVIDRDDSTSEYVLDAGVSLCHPDTCYMNTTVLQGTRMPIQRCNNNSVIYFPGGNVETFLHLMANETPSMTPDAFNLVLKSLRVDDVLVDTECHLPPPPVQNCSTYIRAIDEYLDFRRFMVPNDTANDYSQCVHDSTCRGVRCCAGLPFLLPFTDVVMFKNVSLSFVLDPCELTVSFNIGTYSRTDRLLDYEWGKVRGVMLGSEPHSILYAYAVAKDDSIQHFIVSAQYKICFYVIAGGVPSCAGGELEPFPILTDDLIPYCGVNATHDAQARPPNIHTVVDWLAWRGFPNNTLLSTGAKDNLLTAFSLTDALSVQECDYTRPPFSPASAGFMNECPRSIKRLPILDDTQIRCNIFSSCDGVVCCANTNLLGVMSRSITLFLFVDNCHYQIRGGIEQTYFKFSTYTYNWADEYFAIAGGNETYDVSGVYKLKYNIKRNLSSREIALTLSLLICPSTSCEEVPIMVDTRLITNECNPSEVVPLSHNDNFNLTITEFMEAMNNASRPIEGEVLEGIIRSIGLASIIHSTPVCASDSLPATSCSAASGVSGLDTKCQALDNCRGFSCCIPITLPFMSRAFHVKVELTRCEYWMTVEFERFQFNRTLFLMSWGVDQYVELGNSARMKYNIQKDDSNYYFSVFFIMTLPGVAPLSVTLASNYRLPMDVCAPSSSYHLPYSQLSSMKTFINGRWPDYYTWEGLFRQYKYHPQMLYQPCRLPAGKVDYCPHLTQTSATNPLSQIKAVNSKFNCLFDRLCHGFICCMRMDFVAFTYPMSVRSVVDPCEDTYSIQFERVFRNGTANSDFWNSQHIYSINNYLDMIYNVSTVAPSVTDPIERVEYDVSFSTFIEDTSTYNILKNIRVPKERCVAPSFNTAWPGGSLQTFATAVNLTGDVTERLMKRLGIEATFFRNALCSGLNTANVTHANCPSFAFGSGGSGHCEMAPDCLNLRCCVPVTLLNQISKPLDIRLRLDPCEYDVFIDFETETHRVDIFDNWGVEKRLTTNSNAFELSFRALSNDDGDLVVDLSVLVCVDKICLPGIPILSSSVMPVPVCRPDGQPMLYPRNSSSILEHKRKSLGRLMDVQQATFFKDSPCVAPTRPPPSCPLLSLSPAPGFTCSSNDHCSGVSCCYNLDTGLVSRSVKVWALADMCDFQISFGIENWSFNSSLVNYTYGTLERRRVANTTEMLYNVSISSDLKSLVLSVTFSVNITRFGVSVPPVALLSHQTFPMPRCNLTSLHRAISWPQQSLAQSPSGALLSFLPYPSLILPSFFPQPSPGPACPHLPLTGKTVAGCVSDAQCRGIVCALQLHLGVIERNLKFVFHLNPCTLDLSLVWERWAVNTSLIGKFGVRQTERVTPAVTIGYGVNISTDGMSLILDSDLTVCPVGLQCQRWNTLKNAVMEVPFCSGDGSLRWPSAETMTVFGVTQQVASGILLNSLGVPAVDDLFTTSCSAVNPTSQSSQCPAATNLASLPYNSAGVSCNLDRQCLGVVCCADLDLTVTSRTFRSHLVIDPCDFVISVGFENEFYNTSMFAFSWGTTLTRDVGNVRLSYAVAKASSVGRSFLLSLSLRRCHGGTCTDKQMVSAFSLTVPHCNANTKALTYPVQTYSNMLPNVVGTSADFFKATECSLPSAVTCATMSLPSPSRCVPVSSLCNEVKCCYSVDLFVVQRRFAVDFKYETCTKRVTLNVENMLISETLTNAQLGQNQSHAIGTAMTVTYRVDSSNVVYDSVDLSLRRCWHDLTGAPHGCVTDVYLQASRFPKPTCSRRRRRRRSTGSSSSSSVDMTHALANSKSAETAGHNALWSAATAPQRLIQEKYNAQKAILQNNYKEIKNFVKDSGSLAKTGAKMTVQAVSKIPTSVVQSGNNAILQMRENLKNAYNYGKSSYVASKEILAKASAAAKTASASAYRNTVAGMKAAKASAGTALQNLQTKMSYYRQNPSAAKQAMMNKYNTAAASLAARKDAASAKATAVYNKAVSALSAARTSTVTALKAIPGRLSNAYKGQVSNFQRGYAYTKQSASGAWSKFSSAAKQAPSALKSSFNTAVSAANRQATNVGAGVKSGITSAQNTLSSAYKSAQTGTSNLQNSALNTYAFVKQDPVKAASTAAASAKAKAAALLKTMKTSCKATTDRAKDWLKQLRTKLQKMSVKAKYNTRIGNDFAPPTPEMVDPSQMGGSSSTRMEEEAQYTDGPMGMLGTPTTTYTKRSVFSIGAVDGEGEVTNLLTADTSTSKATGASGSHYTFGSGLTSEGIKLLGRKLASMTFGQLETSLDIDNVPAAKMRKIRGIMRNLTFTILVEVLDKLINGGFGLDLDDFDLKLSGQFFFPVRTIVIFEYTWSFIVGGLVPVDFTFGAGASYGLVVGLSAKILALEINVTATPTIYISVWGKLSIGAGLYVGIQLIGKIAQLIFPGVAELHLKKFPAGTKFRVDMELIPIALVLNAIVEAGAGPFKVELFKAKLWEYSTAKIVKKGLISFGDEKKDNSPPVMSEPTGQGTGSSSTSTRSTSAAIDCDVIQIEGRDITEPAFQIAFRGEDDSGEVRYFLDVGTAPGGSDVFLDKELGGPTTIVEDYIEKHSRPLYFTVKGRNSGGGETKIHCSIPSYDVTLPTGRMRADFKSTSNPGYMSGTFTGFDDSPIIEQRVGIGYGKDIWGDSLVNWQDFSMNSNDIAVQSSNVRDKFTKAVAGRTIGCPIKASSTAVTVEECMSRCVALPTIECMSINYDALSTSTCELQSGIESAPTCRLTVADGYYYYERLGLGYTVELVYDGIWMVHNQLGFFNIELTNLLKYTDVISSDGVLIDLTPPDSGYRMMNITFEEFLRVPCANLYPDNARMAIWQPRCRGQHPLVMNMRVITDGDNSETIYNGGTPKTEVLFDRANSYLAANWDGIHDNETDVFNFAWTSGFQPCEERIFKYLDPHTMFVRPEAWTNTGVNSEIPAPYTVLPDARYYMTTRAFNKADYGGLLSTDFCHTTPMAIDNTDPFVYEVYNGLYDEDTHYVQTTYNSSDPQSGVHRVDLCLGHSTRDCLMMDFVQNVVAFDPMVGGTGKANATQAITDGIPAWPKIRAVNGVDLRAMRSSNTPILIDMTPPIAGTVYDGNVFLQDFNFTMDRTRVCTNWYNFYDPESGIAFYQVCVGSQPNGSDIAECMEFSYKQTAVCVVLLPANYLPHNKKYFVTVYAFNAGHRQLKVSAASDGVIVDLTAPVAGTIVDGTLANFTDLVFSSHLGTVSAQWQGFYDPESSVASLDMKVDIQVNMSGSFESRKSYTSLSVDATNVDWHNFYLRHRDVIRSTLKVTNYATNLIEASTNTFVVDLTPPELRNLGDGLTLGSDVEWQNDDTKVACNWLYEDQESGLLDFKAIIYEKYQGTRMQISPVGIGQWVMISNPAARTNEQTGLSLRNGARYSTKIGAENRARMSRIHISNGVVIDNIPPTFNFVKVGVGPDMDEITLNGKVWQQDPRGILASWQALDGESGVANYRVCVGSSSGSCDKKAFTDMGFTQTAYISGLSLNLHQNTSELYYVTVVAIDGAGNQSPPRSSTPVAVVEEDKTGLALDGAGPGVDIDYTKDRATVTARFEGFQSRLNGLKGVSWAIGSAPGLEDVQALTSSGCVLVTSHNDTEVGFGVQGAGSCQAPVMQRKPGPYFVLIRVTTTAGRQLWTVTDGVVLDTSAPSIQLLRLGVDASAGRTDLNSSALMYQAEADWLVAQWRYVEPLSEMLAAGYMAGHFPGDQTVKNFTWTTISTDLVTSLLNGVITPDATGRPTLITVRAFNLLGLSSEISSPAVVVDTTAPVAGLVTCPTSTQAVTELTCTWSGFRDDESPITEYRFALGTAAGLSDVYGFTTLSATTSHHQARSFKQALAHKGSYFATVVAVNVLGFERSAFSAEIKVDDTPPVGDIIVELPGIYHTDLLDLSTVDPRNEQLCTNRTHCLSIDAQCTTVLTQIAVTWIPFTDTESGINRYELAVGTNPGGGQIRQFFAVPSTASYYLIKGLNLQGKRRVFVTVKAYNGAGHFAVAISNGVYVSYVSQGLSPLSQLTVQDKTDPTGDKDYQSDIVDLSAKWDFSGDPCPFVKYYWRIERIDGMAVQGWVDVLTATESINDDVSLHNGETYVAVVQGVNQMGLNVYVRSDGITVQKEALLTGNVFDGDVFGFDLLYQRYVDHVMVNWRGFGLPGTQGTPKPPIGGRNQIDVTTTATPNNTRTNLNQEVLYYEVALGTDRRFPKTRDNVVPFTNVGTNLSHTFYDLTLVPRTAIYYFTVRAHSAAMDMSEVTSNGFYAGYNSGVRAGQIVLRDWWNNATYLRFSWQDFHSDIGMYIYHAGISSHREADDIYCKRVIEGGDLTAEESERIFNILPATNVGEQTFAEIFNLTLNHTQEYFVYLYGTDLSGACNVTSKAFKVDITLPTEGQVRSGPYYNMKMTFAQSSDSLSAVWKDYQDDESGLKQYEVQLLSADSCANNDSANLRIVEDWIVLSTNESSYTYILLTLQANRPYYIKLRVTNNAESSIESVTEPVVLDTSSPTAGEVADGWRFPVDKFWLPTRDTVRGSFLHLASSEIDPCPLRSSSLDNTEWSNIVTKGLINVNNKVWQVVYLSEQTSVLSGVLNITMERDAVDRRMRSGAYAKSADIQMGGKYRINIMAGNTTASQGKAVTSVVFWDGDEGTLGEFNWLEEADWTAATCACCRVNPITVDCLAICNCTSFLADELSQQNAWVNETTVGINPNLTTPTMVPTTEAPSVPWVVVPDPLPGDTSGKNLAIEAGKSACGFQIIPGWTNRGVLWCRYANDTYRLQSAVKTLPYDVTSWHTYELKFYRTFEDSRRPTWCFKVNAVDVNIKIGALCGVPKFSTSTKIVFHVWNRDNWVYDLKSPFDSFAVSSYFARVEIPPTKEHKCRYGEPFIGGTNAIVAYEAGVGTAENADDVVPFRVVDQPCVPCAAACDRYYCSPSCPRTRTVLKEIKLTGLSLHLTAATENSDGQMVNSTALYFLSVRAVLASGASTTTSSNGFSVDITPPTVTQVLYVDVDVDMYVSTNYQQSNATIRAMWQCVDDESMVEESRWAIGTTPGGTDLQPFVSVGTLVAGQNDSLVGQLLNNRTVYVSVECINGAGLSTLYNDTTGVTPLYTQPDVDAVPCNISGAETFTESVIPAGALKSTNANSAGASWTISPDPAVDRYYYCVGSSNSSLDDIIPCFMVARNQSGSVRIEGGNVYIDDWLYTNLSDLAQPLNQSLPSSNAFQMEPGRTLIHSMKICTAARKCAFKYITSVAITDASSSISVATAGVNTMQVDGSSSGRRRRRSASSGVSVKTPSSTPAGTTLVMGSLSPSDTARSFSSSASIDFKPFIVDPSTTSDLTERLLLNRMRTTPNNSFYVSPLGNVEMPGPLEVSVPYDPATNNDDTAPVLVHWDTSQQTWVLSNSTCASSPTSSPISYDPGTGMMTVSVCGTRKTVSASSNAITSSRRKRSSSSSGLSSSTMFSSVVISTTIPNTAPTMTSAYNPSMEEDAGTLTYTLTATDAEGDSFAWSLDTSRTAAVGTVTLSSTGDLSYRPPQDFSGTDVIPILITELRNDGVPALSSAINVTVTVTPKNDQPGMLFLRYGKNLFPSTSSAVNSLGDQTVEEYHADNWAFQPYKVQVAGFDADISDALTIRLQQPGHGLVEFVTIPSNATPSYTFSCSGTISADSNPCESVSLTHGLSSYSWSIAVVQYTPHLGFYGWDSFAVAVTDPTGYSRILQITIAVLQNSCRHNGTCVGLMTSDAGCTSTQRATVGFDTSYACICPSGWTGPYCEQEIDECASNPCEYPYACYDLFNGYYCECPMDRPFCDSELNAWQIALIAIACLAVVIGIIVPLCWWLQRYRAGHRKDEVSKVLYNLSKQKRLLREVIDQDDIFDGLKQRAQAAKEEGKGSHPSPAHPVPQPNLTMGAQKSMIYGARPSLESTTKVRFDPNTVPALAEAAKQRQFLKRYSMDDPDDVVRKLEADKAAADRALMESRASASSALEARLESAKMRRNLDQTYAKQLVEESVRSESVLSSRMEDERADNLRKVKERRLLLSSRPGSGASMRAQSVASPPLDSESDISITMSGSVGTSSASLSNPDDDPSVPGMTSEA